MTGLVSFMHEGKSGFGRLKGEKVADLTQIFADRFANLSAAANAGALDELFSACALIEPVGPAYTVGALMSLASAEAAVRSQCGPRAAAVAKICQQREQRR